MTSSQSLIRDLEQSVRMLTDQVKYLLNHPPAPAFGQMQNRTSPGPPNAGLAQSQQLSQLLGRQPNMAPLNQPSGYQAHSAFQQPPPPPQQPPVMHGPWFGPNIAAPQASHPTAPPPIPQQQTLPRATPPVSGQEEWDDAYLAVLGSQDVRQLRELLSRSNPEVIMPLNGPSPLSQAVMLTLVHRVCGDLLVPIICD